MRTRRVNSLGLAPFLAELAARLRALPAAELHARLLAHAEQLPADQRAGFLALFTGEPPAPTRRRASRRDGKRLLADIDAFVDRIRSGAYVDGWGWDDELREERAFGDESWAGEMDELFDQAAAVFLAGDLELAHQAYGRLLEAFSLDQEPDTFCGPDPPTLMVDTDLGEAKARYLRAVYETTPLAGRAEQLEADIHELDHIAEPVSLRAIAETRPAPLPDLQAFLPDLIEILQGRLDSDWAQQERRLLAEAAVLLAGTDALAGLARRPGPQQPALFEHWIGALEREGRTGEAAAAAREALATLGAHGEGTARIAERLARLLDARQDAEAVLDARRRAWRAAPSRTRLLALHAAATLAGRTGQVLGEEADLLDTTPGELAASMISGQRLACELLLLAGRVEPAVARLQAADPLGWSGPTHPGAVVLPWLLVAATGKPAPAGTLLADQLREIDHVDRWGAYGLPDLDDTDLDLDDADTVAASLAPDAASKREHPSPSLSALLAEGLARGVGAAEDRARWLGIAQALADARVAAIVDAKHRGAYQRAAALLVACAEALALAGRQAAAAELVTTVRDRYPRHVAFRRELDQATRSSPLLPAPPAKRR